MSTTRPPTIADITDGTSNTICIMEVWRGHPMERMGGGPVALNRCDRWIAAGTCEADSNRAPNDPLTDQVDWDNDYLNLSYGGRGRVSSSMHVGGVHALIGDGTVNFLSNNIDLTLYRAVTTRAGNESKTLE